MRTAASRTSPIGLPSNWSVQMPTRPRFNWGPPPFPATIRRATPVEQGDPMRADAVRNRDTIVAAAGAVVAEQGAAASLEEIARRAGVGSATLHRHFPDRYALLEAVFAERVASLCGDAAELLT